jgi:hypothetical protein
MATTPPPFIPPPTAPAPSALTLPGTAAPPVMSPDILGEIDRAHASLSPPAKDAIDQAHGLMGLTPPGGATPAPTRSPLAAPDMSTLPARPLPSLPIPSENQMNLDRMRRQGSGISQLPAFARIPLSIVDAIGRGLVPGIEMGIPGTSGHHDVLVNQQRGAVKDEQTASQDAAREAQEEAQTGLAGAQTEEAKARTAGLPATQSAAIAHTTAQTGHENAETEALKNPKPDKTGTVHEDADGNMWVVHPDGSANAVAPQGGQQLKGKTAEEKTGTVHEDGDGNMFIVKGDGTATPVTSKGQQLRGKTSDKVASPEQQFLDEYKAKNPGSSIADAEKAFKAITPPEKPPNPESERAALDREATHYAGPHQKAVDAANAQLEKIDEASSMIGSNNAEAQALGIPKVLTALVSGQGSGVRITQAELNQIAHARGIQGDFQGFLNKLSSGKSLTTDQQRQLAQVLSDAKVKISQKQAIANDALDRINSAKGREEMAGIDKDARKKLADMESGKSDAADPHLKAYADQYFGGDVKKAQDAIAQQKK